MCQIKLYQGYEIDSDFVKKKIDEIDNSRLPENVVSHFVREDYYSTIYEENEFCILGEDWFLLYSVEGKDFAIDFLESKCDYKNALKRSIEMLAVFRKLLSTYKSYHFSANLNKFSYPLYDLALKKSMIIESYRDGTYPEQIDVEFFANPEYLRQRKINN